MVRRPGRSTVLPSRATSVNRHGARGLPRCILHIRFFPGVDRDATLPCSTQIDIQFPSKTCSRAGKMNMPPLEILSGFRLNPRANEIQTGASHSVNVLAV